MSDYTSVYCWHGTRLLRKKGLKRTRSDWQGDMRKEYTEILVGVFVAVVLLCAGYVAIKLANENVETMVERTTWTQKIIAAH